MIFISFAGVKQNNYSDTVKKIKKCIVELYNKYDYIMESDIFNNNEKELYALVKDTMDDVTAQGALNTLSNYLSRYYKKKVIILFDEYDTPMQEAYINGFWNELVDFIRSLFNSTFKTNPYLERAVMTGITTAEYSAVRKFAKQTSNGSALAETISKESIFSDLNNLNVITTTSDEYCTSFGFTENEVFAALDESGLPEKKMMLSFGMMDLLSESIRTYIIRGRSQIILTRKNLRRIGLTQVPTVLLASLFRDVHQK